MLRLSYDQGVRHIVATPHFYADEMVPEVFLEKRQAAFEAVTDGEGIPALHLGAEVAYFGSMSRSDALRQMQIDNTGLLLVEMPFGAWNDRIVEDVCMLTDRQGLTPVLAHVNRYKDKQQFSKYRDQLQAAGVLFQYNAGAFLRSGMRSWALKQLKAGYAHFLGSDCHNMTTRKPNLQEAVALISKKLGQETVDRIYDFSAEALQLF